MQNIIAVVWDFDKTLVDGYMQDPIFEEYGISGPDFWKETNDLPKFYKENQNVKVNPDTIYLNQFIKYAQSGKFKGLNNTKLMEFGDKLKFYLGIPDIFEKINTLFVKDALCKEYNIKVEHYIVSTGFAQTIRGSAIMKYVEEIWGCELIEAKNEHGELLISEIGYTIDNTSKTRALFEINKGINKHKNIDVNSKVSSVQRRIAFENMIYIADGPSDVPAFSVVKEKGGSTFAVYPAQQNKYFKQVEQLRKDGRIDMFAEADYRDNTTASMWICNKIIEFADRIKDRERAKQYIDSVSPKHITEK